MPHIPPLFFNNSDNNNNPNNFSKNVTCLYYSNYIRMVLQKVAHTVMEPTPHGGLWRHRHNLFLMLISPGVLSIIHLVNPLPLLKVLDEPLY